MIELPFTTREFFELFGDYNRMVWPAQYVLYAIAALILALLIRRSGPRAILALLALLWFWMAVVYHRVFFIRINPAAIAFAMLFLLEAALLVPSTRYGAARSAGLGGTLGMRVGKALVAYALVGYPLVGYLVGQRFPETPTFGVPCPTTIFTLGVLLWYPWRLRWWVMAIPLLWAAIAASAMTELSVPQDYGLAVAAVLTLLVLARRPLVMVGRGEAHA